MKYLKYSQNCTEKLFENSYDHNILAIGQFHEHFAIFTKDLFVCRAIFQAGTEPRVKLIDFEGTELNSTWPKLFEAILKSGAENITTGTLFVVDNVQYIGVRFHNHNGFFYDFSTSQYYSKFTFQSNVALLSSDTNATLSIDKNRTALMWGNYYTGEYFPNENLVGDNIFRKFCMKNSSIYPSRLDYQCESNDTSVHWNVFNGFMFDDKVYLITVEDVHIVSRNILCYECLKQLGSYQKISFQKFFIVSK